MTDVPSATITDDWITDHFDILSPALGRDLHPILARTRSLCPVAHSDRYGGYWVATRYEDVLAVAQNWRDFSSELGIAAPELELPADPDNPRPRIIPLMIDPPLHTVFKRLITAHFTPAVVGPWEAPTRVLVNRLIDEFIEKGECDFMADFARPFPGLAFFDLALHAPAEELEEVNHWATTISTGDAAGQMEGLARLSEWIGTLVARRRRSGPVGDVVDAVIDAEPDGRPITPDEIVGTIQLLILGGLETTSGVLGAAMLRFCEHPEIPALLRERPELVPAAVEELLRLDDSFVCIGRTARNDTEVGGHPVKAGEKVMVYWVSANRDATEFEDPDAFDLDRPHNRHLAFGAGPHRCAGSNLARMNLRVAVSEIVRRLGDIRLRPDAEIEYYTTFSRSPKAVPITFAPGIRSS